LKRKIILKLISKYRVGGLGLYLFSSEKGQLFDCHEQGSRKCGEFFDELGTC
jgi:hypothetical protein